MLSKKNNKGITLIALVVSIILLLILAGISIQILTNKGLFVKVDEAKKKTENAQIEENGTLTNYESTIGKYVSGTREQITVDKEEYEQLKSDVQSLKQNSANSIKFIDFSNVLTTIKTAETSWTETEDCAVICQIQQTSGVTPTVYVNDVVVLGLYTNAANTTLTDTIYVKKGSIIKTREAGNYSIIAYGMIK